MQTSHNPTLSNPEHPLLQGDGTPAGSPVTSITATNQTSIIRRVCVSHFLSTWNSRVFEFGAVLYLASIFPDTLLPMSLYALARGGAAVLFAPVVGHYIDTGDRLAVVRFSIVAQRVVVALSCAVFWLLSIGAPQVQPLTPWLLVLLALLACIEKLCSVMNLVSVEKDWVVVIAMGDESALQALNAKMRRIDLACKLAGPLAIGLIDGVSTQAAIIANFATNLASVPVEYFAIAKVYQIVQDLQCPKNSHPNSEQQEQGQDTPSLPQRVMSNITRMTRSFSQQLSFYCRHRTFLPSFAGALLYLTVLSFSGQMVTYLLLTGYSSVQISVARTVSVASEMSATWLAPLIFSRIGPVRTGIWSISWQISCLTGAVSALWFIPSPTPAAAGLVIGTILSRIGLWGFDLSVQIIVQEDIEPAHRGSFSSVEAAWQNIFELASYACTVLFSRPDQFHWPVLISYVAVLTAAGLYARFVRVRRGHLFHLPRCIDTQKNALAWRRGGEGYEQLLGPDGI